MELVPFLDKWTGSESKLDLKAIYRRSGPGVTLTGPLPLRRHKDWAGKGLQYVTLATMKDLGEVAGELRGHGYDPLLMRSCYDREGNFNVPAYLKLAQATDEAFLADLQHKVDKFGAETVVEMMRMSDAAFTLPAGIRTEPEPVKAPEPEAPKGKK